MFTVKPLVFLIYATSLVLGDHGFPTQDKPVHKKIGTNSEIGLNIHDNTQPDESSTNISPVLTAENFKKDEERILGYKFEDDAYGMFAFDDTQDWDNYNIMPNACISEDGNDYVSFTMYGEGNNGCKKKSLGMYKVPLHNFLQAYGKDMYQQAARNGGQYKVDQNAMMYLYCSPFYYNNNMFYMRVSCREQTGQGITMSTYSDEYCTTKMSTQFNSDVDLSLLRISFGNCRNCVGGNSSYNGANYNNNNNNNYSNYNYNYNNKNMFFRHSAPLCSAAWQYKDTCNRRCRRNKSSTSRTTSSSSSGGGGWFGGGGIAGASSGGSSYSGDEYSFVEHFFLWFLSLNAAVWMMAGLAMRKRRSKQELFIEESAINAAGIHKTWIPRIILLTVGLLTALILFRRRIFMWFCLGAVNVAVLAYFCFQKEKSAQRELELNGYRIQSDSASYI